MNIPDSERERWSDVGDHANSSFDRVHLTDDVPMDPEPLTPPRVASDWPTVERVIDGPPPFETVRERIIRAGDELAAHEEGAHGVFIDAPDWYWAIAGHLIGWRRDVIAWVGLFVAGLFLGIMVGTGLR